MGKFKIYGIISRTILSGGSVVKNPPAKQETWDGSLGQEDALEKGMATYSSILAWEIPWTEEPSGLQNTGSQKSWTRTTMRYHLLLVRMAAIKKSTNNTSWRGCGEKGTLLHYWWECKLVQPLWRTVWRLLKKLEIELPYDPAIPLLDIHTEETRIERDTRTPMFITALL